MSVALHNGTRVRLRVLPGLAGPRGPVGPGVNIRGVLPDVGSLPATGEPGYGYVIGGDLYVWGNGDVWSNIGPFRGPQGSQGGQGGIGPVGPQGIKGSTGDAGAQGPTGAQGTQGAAGAPGAQGLRGPEGPQGSTGPMGVTGPQGSTGAQGPQGATGPQGLTGTQGPTGAQGPQGATGTQGPIGERGPQGLQGAEGPQGVQGAKGAKGDKGDRGDSFQVNETGALADRTDFDSEPDGFAYLATDTGMLYIRQGASGWSDGIPFGKGDKGDKGDAGADGLQGIQGPQGLQGPAGDEGPQGIQGVKGDRGDEGPIGEQGIQGIQGVKGDTGDQGTQGVQGLKGDPGDAGAKGDKGDRGDQGVPGVQGIDGPEGPQGVEGPKGDTGDIGATGPGVAAGGATGQALVKTGPGDNVTGWDTIDKAFVGLANVANKSEAQMVAGGDIATALGLRSAKSQNLADLDDKAAATENLLFVRSDAGAVARSVAHKLSEWVSVKDFGAVGDGVTDDAPAFQAALDALKLGGGGKLLVPASGQPYLLLSTISHDATTPMLIEGQGRSRSIIKAGAGVTTGLSLGGAVYQSAPQQLVNIGFAQPVVSTCVQVLVSKTVLDVESVAARGGAYAFSLAEVFSFRFSNCQFNDTRGPAINAPSATTAHNSVVQSCGFFGCGVAATTPALLLVGSDNILITQNQFEFCYAAFELRGCTAVSIISNYIEYGHHPFYFGLNGSSRCRGVTCSGNWIALFDNEAYIENIAGGYFFSNTIYNQAISFGPNASQADIVWGHNAVVGTSVVAAQPWNTPTLINGWAAATSAPGYKMMPDGTVVMRGGVTRSTGSGNQTICILPEIYWPSSGVRGFVSTATNAAIPYLVSASTGSVYVEAGGSFTGEITLSAISFLAR